MGIDAVHILLDEIVDGIEGLDHVLMHKLKMQVEEQQINLNIQLKVLFTA